MTILWCISDHGYGHATRSLAVIMKLKERVIVRTKGPAALIRRDAPRLRIIEERNDIGLLQKKDSFSVDIRKTKHAVTAWLEEWDKDVACIRRHIRKNNIRLVISDSSPQPFLAAKAEGIPCVFLGSFTWIDIYDFAKITTRAQRQQLIHAYNASDLGIILPFHAPCKGIKKKHPVALVARSPGRAFPRVARSVLFAVGGSLNGTRPWRAKKFTGTVIIPPEVPYTPAQRTIRIPKKTSLTDCLRAADIVVGKSGYGLVAEAIRARRPLLLIRRPEFLDDHIVIRDAVRLGIAAEIAPGALATAVDDGIFKKAARLRRGYARLPAAYRGDGARQAARIIEGFA